MSDAPPLPPWLTTAQFAVLRRIVGTLERWGVPYVASGGLAGNLHGSRWPLHDLDFDVPERVLPRLARRFRAAVRFGPAPHVDEEFALVLLTLRLDGVDVDPAAAETVALQPPTGSRLPWPTDLRLAEQRRVADVVVRAMPLDRLVEYKRVIGRKADLQELGALAGAAKTAPPHLSTRDDG